MKKQLDTSSPPSKDDMLYCVMHLAGDKADCEGIGPWVNAMDDVRTLVHK